jgi:CBS domain-containing protein
VKAREVMSSPVVTLGPDTPAHAAAALLVSHGFTAAPVVDADGHMIGIATEADLVRGRGRAGGVARGADAGTDGGCCDDADAVRMRPDDDVADVVSLMLESNLRSVPIVEDGELVGIVSRRDVLRRVARRELT